MEKLSFDRIKVNCRNFMSCMMRDAVLCIGCEAFHQVNRRRNSGADFLWTLLMMAGDKKEVEKFYYLSKL